MKDLLEQVCHLRVIFDGLLELCNRRLVLRWHITKTSLKGSLALSVDEACVDVSIRWKQAAIFYKIGGMSSRHCN